MQTIDLQSPAWHPIASSDDLQFRHVFHAQLLGRELAVWRADDGNVNVWENRCLHRGVRLSIGINDGAELKCQYHGWRYANRSAGCTYIPAHPADAPARRITNRTFRAVEHRGLVWSALDDAAGPFPGDEAEWFALRPLPVNAAPEVVLAALAGAAASEVMPEPILPLGLRLQLAGSDEVAEFYIQPVDAGRSVLRGVLARRPVDPLQALHTFDDLLEALRERVEMAASRVPAPEPMAPAYAPVSVELATMPDLTIGRQATLRVRVARKRLVATDVVALELAPLTGQLPTLQPGAHIDLHLPSGLVRQYSLTNGPGEQETYVIGVKREPESRGGSVAIHDTLREGDVVAISEPRNNFPLRRDAVRTVLVGGGIGLTPLLAMAKALKRQGLAFELHAFARSAEHLPFSADLAALGEAVTPHLGLSADVVVDRIAGIVASPGFAHHLYLCGPGPLMELVRAGAARAGWTDKSVHFEYFRNDTPLDTSSSFTVELARSALTLAVPAGRTILDVMRENGIDTPSSCEQGACGTCLTTVLDGIPDHQDVYLNETEKSSNRCMLTCVSRAKSDRLVLDI